MYIYCVSFFFISTEVHILVLLAQYYQFFYQGFVSDVQEFLIYEHMSFVHVHAVKCM